MNQELKKEAIIINDKEIIAFVDYDMKDIYMSQKEFVVLFDKQKKEISRLLNIILKEKVEVNNGENYPTILQLSQKIRTTEYNYLIIERIGPDSKKYKVKHYNLSVITEIGYRINYDLTNELLSKINDLFNQIDNNLKTNNSLNNAINYEIVKFNDGEISLDVNVSPKEDTVWLNQKDIGLLFDCSKSTISYHINNIFESKELDDISVVRKIRTTGIDNKVYETKYYNLDMIISIGYRVNSKRGIEFRRWASSILKQYLLSGYSINDKRLLQYDENIISLNNRVYELEKDNLIIKNTLYGEKYKKIKAGDIPNSMEELNKILSLANKKITIIDNYIDEYFIRLLEKYDVEITIITGNSKITNLSLKSNIIIKIDGSFHSRYILIDDLYTYILTHSLNIIGKKDFEIIFLEKVKPYIILK